MNARHLTRATNALLVVGTGMVAGHLLMPARVDAGLARRVAFVGLLAASGALAGWRERGALAWERDAPAPRARLWMPVGAMAALLLGALAWYVVHG